jgi:hypothetical protein
MLKETRSPAIVIATRSLSTGTGTDTVAALADLYRNATELADQSNSVR